MHNATACCLHILWVSIKSVSNESFHNNGNKLLKLLTL